MLSEEEISCVVLGGQGVGKTTLIQQLIGQDQSGPQLVMPCKTTWVKGSTHYNISIYEASLSSGLAVQADMDIYIFVYDVTSRQSFEQMKESIFELDQLANKDNKGMAVVMGSKNDKAGREISFAEGQQLGKEYGIFVETNYKDALRTEEICSDIWETKYGNPNKYQNTDQSAPAAPGPDLPPLQQESPTASPSQLSVTASSKDFCYLFSTILVGFQAVGKTQFSNRLASLPFKQEYIKTIGVDFQVLYAQWKHQSIKLNHLETSGAQRFEAITKMYYRGASVCFILYDVGDRLSFDKVRYYHQAIKDNSTKEKVAVAVVGNKTDRDDRKVKREEGEGVAEQIGALFFQLSCRDETEVKNCYLKTVEHFLTTIHNSK